MGYYPIWEFFWNWENPVVQVGEVRLSNDFLANGQSNLLRGIENYSGAIWSVFKFVRRPYLIAIFLYFNSKA